jgi:small subunit ribosomal protein S19
MVRALWKGPFLDACFFRRFEVSSDAKKDTKYSRKVWSRRSLILPEFLHEFFEIHNGKEFLRVQITEEMIGHKFGEFASTRKKTLHKKKLKK